VKPILGIASLLALVLAATVVPVGEGPAAGAIRVAAPFIAGLGLLPVAFAATRGRAWTLGLAIVAATCGGVLLGTWISKSHADRGTLVAWVLISFGTLFGLVAPLLVLGWRATAAAAWIGLAAVACGSLLLARSGLEAIPEPLLNYNPIVRMFWHGLSFDWLHAANMYPKVGTIYYRYPERSDGILVTLLAGVCGLAASALIAFSRRHRMVQR
jgi:hypothetical protein